jgi:hypothetical protein
MERKTYLESCQKFAVGMDVFVMHDGIRYRPVSLSLWFDKKGSCHNTAVLKDLNGKAVINCRVEDVDG